MCCANTAKKNDLDLVITKEGLMPEFEIDGIAYTAQCVYRRMGPVPVLIVRCTALYPDELETDVPRMRGKFMKFFHNWWILMIFLLIWIPRVIQTDADHRWEVLLIGGVLGVTITSMY